MATPIPGFASQVFATDQTVQVTGGTVQALATTRYYYFVSNRTSIANGQSLLKAIKDLLDASLSGTAWTVVLANVGGTYRVQFSHNNGSSRTVTLSSTFATALGFTAGTTAFVVASGATVTTSYPSTWWWTPDMPVSMTGPQLFDPLVSYGVPESAGASQRAPDMTTAYVQNGVQWSATYIFNGVQYLYKVRANGGQQDLETWWLNGPAQGRRFLLWRSRDSATGSNAPGAGSASPYNYVEYAPQETLRGELPAVATVPPNLVYWDVTLDCWVTENGETPLTT